MAGCTTLIVAPLSAVQQWAGVPNARIYLPLPLQFAMLSFDQTTAPWQDIHLRRAMRYATGHSLT